ARPFAVVQAGLRGEVPGRDRVRGEQEAGVLARWQRHPAAEAEQQIPPDAQGCRMDRTSVIMFDPMPKHVTALDRSGARLVSVRARAPCGNEAEAAAGGPADVRRPGHGGDISSECAGREYIVRVQHLDQLADSAGEGVCACDARTERPTSGVADSIVVR